MRDHIGRLEERQKLVRPAEAGIRGGFGESWQKLDSRLRGNDGCVNSSC